VKRLVKIFLAVLLFFLVAIIGVTIYVKVKYPSERLRQLLISYLAEEYKLRVTIARLEFNLFSGFELDGIVLLGTTDDQAPPLAVEKMTFAYRWRSLLARQLDIDGITIEHPAFFYRLNPDSSSNLDGIIAALADSTRPTADTSAVGLPVSIHLKKLSLENLQLNAILASAVDSQAMALGPLNLAVNEIKVDRLAYFSGKLQLRAESAPAHYFKTAFGQRDTLALTASLQSNITSFVNGDSVKMQGKLAFDNAQINLGNSNHFSLPRIGTTADLHYNLASSELQAPEIRLLIDDKEQLTASLEMNQHNELSSLALRVNRGVIDLAELLRLGREHTSGEWRAFLQTMDCAGELEFSGSEFNSDDKRLAYQITLSGRNLAYADYAARLKLNGGNFIASWKTNADSSAAATGKFAFTSFDVPIDTTQILKTGPLNLDLTLALAKDFSLQEGDLDLRWQNFSEGTITAHAAIGLSNISARSGSWLASLLGKAEIKFESLEISPFAANAASGKISGKIALAGKRLDETALHFTLQNENIRYETPEYKGKLPDYHLTASARLLINSALSKFSLPNGKLHVEPTPQREAENSLTGRSKRPVSPPLTEASFEAIYDVKADTFRFNLPNLVVDLAQVMRALPDTILTSMNYAKMQGHGLGSGWLMGKFLEPDSLDYRGNFAVLSEDASYADSVLGIYMDSLQINSEWMVTTTKTTGTYAIACSTPRMPDYLRQPLPPTKAGGKLTVEETIFTIDDGKFEIADWNTAGNYRVDGEFRPAGIQVKTTADLGMHAPEPINVARDTKLRGDLTAQFIIDQYIPNELTAPQPSRLNGWLKIDGLDIKMDTTVAIKNLRADCRFKQDFTLLNLPLDEHPPITFGMVLEPEGALQPVLILKTPPEMAGANFASADEALLMYDLFRDSGRENFGERSWLAIEEMELAGYRFSNLAADLRLGNSRLDIPKFSVNLLDGNLAGNFLVGLGNGNPDSISYATNMQLASIDVSVFRRLRAQLGGKQSRLSANFTLSGAGAAPEKMEALVNQLSGKLNITKIENKVASSLLQMLDPNGTDKGIQNMRLLMKTRWNVKQLTFEIKTGFIYAALAHTKPWYAPFTLPQPLDFARFPLQPYLKTAAE